MRARKLSFAERRWIETSTRTVQNVGRRMNRHNDSFVSSRQRRIKMTDTAEKAARTTPTLAQLANAFARYANFTLGGGSATVAVLYRELLDKQRWITSDDFSLCFALARLTPGTNLLAFCTGVGWLLRGMAGAIVALLGASIPSTIIVVLATALFSHWQDNHWAQAAIHGAIAAAVAITVKTCWTIAHPHFKAGARVRVALIAAAAFLLYVWARLPAIEVLLIAGVVGALLPAVRR